MELSLRVCACRTVDVCYMKIVRAGRLCLDRQPNSNLFFPLIGILTNQISSENEKDQNLAACVNAAIVYWMDLASVLSCPHFFAQRPKSG